MGNFLTTANYPVTLAAFSLALGWFWSCPFINRDRWTIVLAPGSICLMILALVFYSSYRDTEFDENAIYYKRRDGESTVRYSDIIKISPTYYFIDNEGKVYMIEVADATGSKQSIKIVPLTVNSNSSAFWRM